MPCLRVGQSNLMKMIYTLAALARQKLAADPPGRTVTIARDACGTLEFERAEEMIRLGYETAARTLG